MKTLLRHRERSRQPSPTDRLSIFQGLYHWLLFNYMMRLCWCEAQKSDYVFIEDEDFVSRFMKSYKVFVAYFQEQRHSCKYQMCYSTSVPLLGRKQDVDWYCKERKRPCRSSRFDHQARFLTNTQFWPNWVEIGQVTSLQTLWNILILQGRAIALVNIIQIFWSVLC